MLLKFSDEFGYDISSDPYNTGKQQYPRYMVIISEDLNVGYYERQYAIDWHKFLWKQGVKSRILDLTSYDWKDNPFEIEL